MSTQTETELLVAVEAFREGLKGDVFDVGAAVKRFEQHLPAIVEHLKGRGRPGKGDTVWTRNGQGYPEKVVIDRSTSGLHVFTTGTCAEVDACFGTERECAAHIVGEDVPRLALQIKGLNDAMVRLRELAVVAARRAGR
jgi:hypothetical protein